MAFLSFFLLFLIIDAGRRSQFDENFIYLFLVLLLGGGVLFLLRKGEVTKALSFNITFVDLYSLQVLIGVLPYTIFSLERRNYSFANLSLNGFSFLPFNNGFDSIVKRAVNVVNRSLYTATTVSFFYGL
jgi:hypothetical protein